MRPIIVLVAFAIFGCAGCEPDSSSARVEPSFDVSVRGTIVFSGRGSGGSDLYLLDLKSKKVSRLTNTPLCELTPSFSPDGGAVVYSASTTPGGEAHLYWMPTSGGAPIQITSTTNTYDRFPRFSADGKRIVFARSTNQRPYSMGGYTWSDWDIFTVSATGGTVSRLTNNKYYQAWEPAFASGNRVVFMCDGARPPSSQVTVVDSRVPGKPSKLSDGSGSGVSRDGKRIAYISDKKTAFDYEIWTMDSHGKAQVQVTSDHSYTQTPVFTPDGKQILYLSSPKRDFRYALRQIDVNGRNVKTTAGPELFENPMSWKP